MGKLSNYKGAIDLIDGIRQKNGGTFALVEANAVQVNDEDKRLDQELEDIKQDISGIEIPEAATEAPKDLGNAAVGTSDKWAREDHVHKLPDMPEGSDDAAKDLAAIASAGTSDKWSRSDHVHKLPDIPQAATVTPKDLGTAAVGASDKWAREDHVHNKQSTITGNAGSATKLATKRTFSISEGATATAVEFDGSGNVELKVTSLDGTKITGIIPLSSIPKGAQEQLYIVDNKEKRLALTTNEVQNGDVVKETDTQLLYYVLDETKLGTEESEKAFATFAAGSASSVDWSNVKNKPTFATVATSGEYKDLLDPPDIPEGSNDNPKDLGTATPGTSDKWSRSDHIHPEQTSVKNDGKNQEIAATYIKDISSDGTELTIAKGDGTTSKTAINLTAGDNVSLEKSEDGKTTIISSEKTTFKSYTAVVGTTWDGEGSPYTQSINIDGILSSDIPLVDLVLNNDDDYATKLEEYNKLFRITANDGNIVVYATEPTTIDLTIRLRCER